MSLTNNTNKCLHHFFFLQILICNRGQFKHQLSINLITFLISCRTFFFCSSELQLKPGCSSKIKCQSSCPTCFSNVPKGIAKLGTFGYKVQDSTNIGVIIPDQVFPLKQIDLYIFFYKDIKKIIS